MDAPKKNGAARDYRIQQPVVLVGFYGFFVEKP
jgi:hypothetical protein